jgi:hypothetical protein
MLSSLLGSRSEVVQISEDDVRKIMETISHVLLKISTYNIETKRYDTIRKVPHGVVKVVLC